MRLFLFFTLLLLSSRLAAQNYQLASPNGALTLRISTVPNLRWQLDLHNQPLLQPASIALDIAGVGMLGQNIKVLKTTTNSVNRIEHPVVHQKSAAIAERYNELIINCQGDWGIAFRAYDEGVAYRFFTAFKKDAPVIVNSETYTVRPADAAATIWWPEETGFYSHNERVARVLPAASIKATQLASLPALIATPAAKILLTETDVEDYPGLWLRGDGLGNLVNDMPRYPKMTVRTTNRDIKITDREAWLARVSGQRNYPWRLFLVAEKDQDLLANQMPWLLAAPGRIADPSWIKPGKVAWDWWNNLNVYGADIDFKAGVNTATYKYFIDFAAENGLEYIILDEGWSDTGDLTKVNPDVDMDVLAAYARQKKVGLILWVTWLSLDVQLEAALDRFAAWDIKGIKVDFMQRDDQQMEQYYWRVAEAAAKRRLLVDFHGAHKPAGLQRTWPNVISFEGVFGLENCKWDIEKKIGPEHDVTLPFLRNVAGPMDYTPGAMLNYQRADWSPVFNRPGSMGTRCHELAKYVVFESPLQMLSDSPTNYKKEPECLTFLRAVPSVWEKTVPLDGKISDYVSVARQAANGLWYIGVMTDWSARELSIATDFLPEGVYEAEIFADGPNADRNAQDFKRTFVRGIKKGEKIPVNMAPGGGWVAILRKGK